MQAGIASDEEPIIKLTLISKENGCYSSRPAKPNASLVKPQSLYLALEPESAALYCIECAKKDKPSCASSTCYMILDIGGGTVDITAHKVSDAGTIQAILPPRGNDWGGKKINEEFKFFLGNLVGDPTFERYISTGDTETNSKHSADLDMIINQSFEEEKRVFGDKKDHTQEDEILINLPYSFIQTYRQDLEKGIRELNCNDVQFSGDELMLSYIKMDDLFSQSVEEIISCVSECVREVERQCKLASVFFVGGYGGSKYLLGKIRDTLDCRIKTYCPLDHKTAVVSGAVLFHQNPAVIRSRVADATYGAACAIVFDPTIHEQDYAYYDDDHNKKCNSILQPFIIKDDIIDAKYILTKTYKPHVHFLTIMHFEIYTTSSKTIKYICGPRGEKLSEVHKIGELSVQMPDTATDKDREVKLMFDFTHTEIQVEAYDLTSGMKACTTVDFLSDI